MYSAFNLCATDAEGCWLKGWTQQLGILPSYYSQVTKRELDVPLIFNEVEISLSTSKYFPFYKE